MGELERFAELFIDDSGERIDASIKIVSPKQYDVLKEMNSEGKLAIDGLPMIEHCEEFLRRIANG